MKLFSLIRIRMLLRTLLKTVRGDPPALLEVNIPGVQLVHLFSRFYWLRVDLRTLCGIHQAQVEATDPGMISVIEERDAFFRGEPDRFHRE